MILSLSNRTKRAISAIALCAICAGGAFAQKVAIKSNLLYDAALTPSVGVEIGLAPKWTLDLSGQINNWDVNGHMWKQWVVQPEIRYWLCRRFSGHFFAAHALGGQYNFGKFDLPFKFLGTDFGEFKDFRPQGWMAGAGVGYGYSWIIDRHWNFEAEIGIGWVYTKYDTYRCANCGKKVKSGTPHNYVGLTKAALNIIYAF